MHKNCTCQFVTRIDRCEGYKQKPPNEVSDFVPTFFMEKFRNSTKFFRQRLDGIEFTTATSCIVIASFKFSCPGAAEEGIGDLAEVCPICDNEDFQHKLEYLAELGPFRSQVTDGRQEGRDRERGEGGLEEK